MKNLFCITLVTILLLGTAIAAVYLPSVNAIGTVHILADGSVSPPEAPIATVDKITFTLTGNIIDSIVVERSNIIIDGAGRTVEGDGTGNGFTLIGISSVTIRNTNIHNFTYGIYAETATSLVVQDNNITANAYDGIGLFYCSFTTVFANTIARNEYDGIEIYNSSNNNVIGNHIAANAWYGIGIYEYSTGNITENRIEDNYSGIELSYSSQNRIFHNDFTNHTLHASTQFSLAIWDNGYPSGGNFWSDYTGTDVFNGPGQNLTGSDGIGDSPYNCSENNQDKYPLISTFTNLAIQSISPFKNVVAQGYPVNISVSIQNEGWDIQTTNVTVRANATVIATFPNTILGGRSQKTLNLTWQTLSFAKGNYEINASTDAPPAEPDRRDNTLTCSGVAVTIPGDVNADGGVNILDAISLSNAFNTRPGDSGWNPNADINSDNAVNILDAIVLSNHFLEH